MAEVLRLLALERGELPLEIDLVLLECENFLSEVREVVQLDQIATLAERLARRDQEAIHPTRQRRVDVAARLRQQLAVGVELERVGHQAEDGEDERGGDAAGHDDGAGGAADAFLGLGQGHPDEAERDAAVLDGVVEGAGGVAGDHVEARERLLRVGRRLETFHHQRRPRRLLALALALVLERQHHQQLARTLRQVGVERFEHLGRQAVVADAVERQLFAPLQYLIGQAAHEADGVGALLHHVGSADGFDTGLTAIAHGHADAVALAQPTRLVGDEVRDFDGVETAVDLASEGFELRPELFLAGHLAEHLGALVTPAQLAHEGHVLEEAGHGGGRPAGVLPDLDKAHDLLAEQNRHDEEQVVGGVAGRGVAFLGGADAASRRQVDRLALSDGQAQQFAVALAHLIGLVEADFLEVNLELDLKVALGGARPDGAGRGGQRFQQPLEHVAVEHGRRHVRLAQPRNLVQPLAETAALLFDDLKVDWRLGCGGHVSPSFGDRETASKEAVLLRTPREYSA